jgi:Leucine rich repeat
MIDKPSLRPTSRYGRLSVRSFILVVLVIGAVLGWIVRRAHFQGDVVAAIRKAGGDVCYDWQWRDGHSIRNGKPWWPEWLVDLVGADFFGDIVLVVLNNPTDADLILAGNLRRLEAIVLQGRVGQVTNDGLVNLASLTRLKQLQLDSTAIDDIGLDHVSGLTSLRSLSLTSTRISDAGLKKLKRLTQLTYLTLPSNITITDRGLAELSGLVNLESLYLIGTRVSDAGLKHLKGMKRLTYLFVAGTMVTEAGIRRLQEVLPKVQMNQQVEALHSSSERVRSDKPQLRSD